MIPLWAISGLAAGAIAASGGYWVGSTLVQSKLDRERASWAHERTKAAEIHAQALDAEIRAHNATRTELDAIHANAEADRAISQAQAASAAAVADAAQRSAGRLRDALETHRLVTSAALDAAGATGQCQAATEAAAVLRGLLGRLDAAAGGLADAARASSADADTQHAAASECARIGDAMIRASAGP
jgi:hypothetical protein